MNRPHKQRITRPRLSSGLLAAACLFLLALPSLAHAAEPLLLRSFCPTGQLGGQCGIPRGIAVDHISGEIYVANQQNGRIEKFTVWGDFVLAWGWDVVASGPGEKGAGLEVCVRADGDVCKKGLTGGGGAGQFGSLGPQGVAVDSEGDVYVADWSNRRVQKLSSDGEFLLTFGGDVNKTKVEAAAPEAQRNLCPIDPGDVCQAGIEGTGNGQFGFWRLGSYVAIDRKGTESADDDVIYVGDEGRVQEFDSGGHHLVDLPDPDKVLEEGGTVSSLAVAQGNGSVYLGFATGIANPESKPGVHKLSPSGESQCMIEAHNPRATVVGPEGDVYVVEGDVFSGASREISSYDSDCGGREVLFGPKTGDGESENQFTVNPTGIATSSACGIEGTDLIVSNPHQTNSFVKLFGPPPTEFEAPCAPPPPLAPTISDTYALSVGAIGARVRAEVNSHFWNDATYRAQYAIEGCIEAEGWGGSCVKEQPSAPGVLLSEDVFDEPRPTKAIFLGASEPLIPDTAYRYRFTAESSGGGPVSGPEASLRTYPAIAAAKADCLNQDFRIAASSYLPDCRAYEMVSPPDKNGGAVGRGGVAQAAPDGQALTFNGAIFADPEGGPGTSQYLAERGAEGWSTHSINAPRTSTELLDGESFGPRYKALSEDLCSGWLLQDTNLALVEGAPAGVPGLYRRAGLRAGCEGGGYQLLTTVSPPGYDPKTSRWYWLNPQGFSADGEVSVFRAPAALTEDACQAPTEAGPQGSGIFQVYLSREGTPGVAPRLVSVLPSGQAPCSHSTVGTAYGDTSSFEDSIHHAVSENGSRIYWTVTQSTKPTSNTGAAPGGGPGHLYIRINATQPQSALSKAGKCTEAAKACTYPVSEEAEALSGTSESGFLAAAADGSVAYFSTGIAPDEDLYEYDLAKALAKEAAVSLIAGKVRGILGASEDGSRLYLVSEEDLDEGASAGEPNLYLYERGAGFSFIATLGEPSDTRISFSSLTGASAIEITPVMRLSRVSPDGTHAAFVAADPALAASIAGYDNTDAASGRPAREVYLYDAAAEGGEGELVCASCNPSGARPAARLTEKGNSNPDTRIYSAATLSGWITAMHPGNALSADGQRLFFESFEALVLRDTNGAADVYQWQEAASKDQCLEEQGGELYVPASEGCLSLISSGTGATDSTLIDASPSGDDAFILTDASLLPQDSGLADAYDVRVGGGFAQPVLAPACEGEACQSPPAPPDDPTPASASFEGAGNVVEGAKPRPRCPKGKRLVKARGKKSRCVPRKPQRKANAKRRTAR
jgi:DNA-binding beta-propeller fold protein YncE